ncbi:MAG: hypothetical protein H7222_00245 [Methylotenera sp.]|nr:hypothetical protein [Oligoflexia bacterium]
MKSKSHLPCRLTGCARDTAQIFALIFVSIFGLAGAAFAAESGPKFGPAATRLARSHEFIRTHAAPDFWAMMPYYTAQQTHKSCSVASITMMLNGLRSQTDLKASDLLVSETLVAEKNAFLKNAVGPRGAGVALEDLAKSLRELLKTWDPAHVYEVEIVHMTSDPKKAAEARTLLKKALSENEKSAQDFILANFLQGELTGDPEGMVGHISPIGAYDARNEKVLILDPDREYYEPYWVSTDALIKAMATQDSDAKLNRGYVWVKRKS